ncbi:MAG TPA: restriction endonuclease subunit S [Prosthecobacter sp.]|nr:restriction endonuclease subunit S [Prosthecobacter sp.]HRK15227.1 restriction endonuclease subunit S [Prosthecobacter sp.]
MNVRMNGFSRDGLAFIDEEQDSSMSGTRVQPADVLLNITGASIGRVCIAPDEICPANVNQHVCIIRSNGRLEPEWIAFFISQPDFQSQILGQQAGATRQALTKEMIEQFELPAPDLPTQRRLATRLKSQMATVEETRRRVEEQFKHCETLRLKFSAEAFAPEVLFQWEERPLLEMSKIVSGVTLGGPTAKEPTRKVPYLRVANVKDGWLMLDDVKEIDATEREIGQFSLKHGDVVLTEGGDPDKLGRGTVWREEIGLCLHQNHIFRVRFDQDQVCPEFAAYQFASKYGKAYFLAHAKQTTGIASINKGVLSRFPFRLPPLKTQRQIAARLREQFTHLRQLQNALRTQLEALDKLPGAFLREAFGSLAG